MITIAGFNTSLDKYVETETLRPGEVMRVRNVHVAPGGKGVHVALTCAALGEAVRLVGIIDERHGEEVRTFLDDRGVRFIEVHVPGTIRTCVAVREKDGRTTELLEPGPVIDEATRTALASHVSSEGREGEVAVLSGSLPRGYGEPAYAALVKDVIGAGRRALVDASGTVLRALLEAQPFMVKLNRDEASEWSGRSIETVETAAKVVKALFERGVQCAVISLGEDGAVGAWDGRVCRVMAPSQPVRNAVGAGDCLLGGVAVGLTRGASPEDALRLGVAAGAAKTRHGETGMLNRQDVEEVGGAVTLTWVG